MRETMRLRLPRALAGAVAVMLTTEPAARAQPYMTGPPPAQPPPESSVVMINHWKSAYCRAIARAGTPERVQALVAKLKRQFDQSRKDSEDLSQVLHDLRAEIPNVEQQKALQKQIWAGQATATPEQQQAIQKYLWDYQKRVAQMNVLYRKVYEQEAPLLQNEQDITDTVGKCASDRLAQIAAVTPTPLAPQGPPMPALAPLAGQVRWAMTCQPGQGVFSDAQSGQLTTVVGADGSFSGTGPGAGGIAIQVSGQVDATGAVSGTISGVPGSYLAGSLDRNAAQGAGQIGINNPGGWGVCAGQWQFTLQ